MRTGFGWRGHRFAAGTRVLLDLYGTNHDPRLWESPGEFRPERFVGRPPGPFALIPQGGGDHHAQHRCAGEWISIALMKQAACILTREVTCDVPEQDLGMPMNRMPVHPQQRLRDGEGASGVEAR